MMTNFGSITQIAFDQILKDFLLFLPNLFGAIVILIVGLAIASLFGKFVSEIIKALKVDQLLIKLGIEKPLSRTDLSLDSGAFLGSLVKWILIIFTLLFVSNTLGINQISTFLTETIKFIGDVVIAIIYLLIGAVAGNFFKKVVVSSVSAANLKVNFLGTVTKYAIVVFAITAALTQLKLDIVSAFIQPLIYGFVIMLAIAGGIAFGLGGKEQASRCLENLKERICK
ncbi:MAG: hypothetical protein HY219_02400 [Candidatus Staskawiczbacteria bacterium]|nr:hypothetical protein [Candidatus Staskawiczbacteria bacterium]